MAIHPTVLSAVPSRAPAASRLPAPVGSAVIAGVGTVVAGRAAGERG
jgi:hypothetical protein